MKRPEQALQQSVIKYLRYAAPKCLFFHVPNNIPRGDAKARRIGGIMKSMGVLPGVADLLLFWRGGMGAIELKSEKGKQTDSQRLFERQWVYFGGQYAICRSLDEVQRVLNEWREK